MKSFWRKETATALALLLTIWIGGCVVATEQTAIAPQILSPFEGTYKVDPYMEEHRPLTVAVLPFFDRTADKQAFEAVRRGFYNHFSSLPFKDMELYRIDDLLKKAA